jgi:hypothetical protein
LAPPEQGPWSFDEVPRHAASILTPWGSILDPSLQFLHPLPAAAAAYWRSKMRNGRLPTRADIDPLEFPQLLPYVLLFDRVRSGAPAADRFRFRLMGTAMSGFFGELTRQWLDDALPAASLTRYTALLREVVARRGAMREIGRMLFQARTWQVGEFFAGPLVDSEGEITIIFAVLAIWSENAAPAAVVRACRPAGQET